MRLTKSWLAAGLLLAAVGCEKDSGVSPAGNPSWCSNGVSCTDLEVTGLWVAERPVLGQHLCFKINYDDSKIGFYRVPMPKTPTVTLQVPKGGNGAPELKNLWVQAVSDDRVSGDEEICGKPACVAAELKLDVGVVNGNPPTVVAPLTVREEEVKVNVTPEQVGNVTWKPAGTELMCRYPADKDRGSCAAKVAACTPLSLRAGDLQGQGTFAGWSTSRDVGCGSNENPYKLVAGQRPGSSTEGVRLKEFCDANTVTASFLPGRCGPNAGGGKCTLCNPIEALDPGEGSYTCNNQGQWECQNIQRKTVVLKGDDLWLQHECGKASGDGSWGLDIGYGSGGKFDCYMQKGPAMTLPPGRYSVTVNYKFFDASRSYECGPANIVSGTLEMTNLGSGEKKTATRMLGRDNGPGMCTRDQNGYDSYSGSLSVTFILPTGCQRLNFEFRASSNSPERGTLKILNTTITPL